MRFVGGFISPNPSLRADVLLCLFLWISRTLHRNATIARPPSSRSDSLVWMILPLGRGRIMSNTSFVRSAETHFWPLPSANRGALVSSRHVLSGSSNLPSHVALLGELSVTCDGDYAASDDVGFTVYRGHPYCEACHVRLRMPKCKRCKRSIRDGDKAVEALGGKWCWKCFVCKVGPFRCCFFYRPSFFLPPPAHQGCERPFEEPSFFQRGDNPYCEDCFSIILRNEI